MVTVFGLGFVGLTTALGFAHLGYKVYGIDVDTERKNTLLGAKIPFFEPQMEENLKKHLNRNFIITDDVKQAIADSEFVFYCVGTPFGEAGSADLRYLFSAIDTTVAAIQDDKFRVLVTKSTIPPSTTSEKIYPYIQSKGEIAKQIGIANNPEFLREGHCWDDFIGADRIVLGCNDNTSREMLKKLYQPMGIPMYCVSNSTGEFVKYLSNTLLATLISFSNEMAEVADTVGDIDIADAFQILHMDKRWNHCDMTSYVYPGCGYGGYCLPKDTSALVAQSQAKGYEPNLLKSVIDINVHRSEKIVEHITRGREKSSIIGILGLSFKPDSDDVRDTAAYRIIRLLNDLGYTKIVAYDPVAVEEFKKHYVDVTLTYGKNVKEVYDCADVVAIVTAWEEFRDVKTMGNKPIVDCRYMFANLESKQ